MFGGPIQYGVIYGNELTTDTTTSSRVAGIASVGVSQYRRIVEVRAGTNDNAMRDGVRQILKNSEKCIPMRQIGIGRGSRENCECDGDIIPAASADPEESR